ncbi:MAG: RagB/SusD family nutrient uptake outer membrane protein [Prevotella sp.]|nr:RagB/SusD family nutrient uptake outer membrane protein [Prevotella sp.]
MKKNILLSLICTAFLLISCTETSEGFLDSKGEENPDTEGVFADSAYTVQYHTALYMQLGRIAMAPHTASSMIQDYKDYEAGTDNSRHVHFARSEFTPAYTKGDFTQGGINANYSLFKTSWEEMYQSIQRCNTFIKNYEKAPLSEARKRSMVGEARFLRAFYYFHLLRSYGAVPILYDEVLDPFENHQIPRSTFATVVEYLENELTFAANELPLTQDGIDYGRPTKGAALGLLGKLQVLAASPLHNGGNVGSGDNRLLVGYDDYKVERWEKAAKTLEAMMALGTHKLVVDNDTRPGNGFYKATTTRVSKERVWFWITTNAFTFPNNRLMPRSRGGVYRIVPYHELTEAFPAKDGKPIGESDLYNSEKPYDNRDPRLGYTIIYHGATWIKTLNGVQEPVEIYKNELGQLSEDAAITSTGYFFRKCCREEQLGGTTNSEAQGLSFIRYADIMLMYAEALTEIDVNKNRAKIEQQLFELRDRAGIDPGNDKRYGIPANLNKEDMLSLIINERRIEFANECGNRFFDLKRRKLYEKLNGVWTSAAVWVKAGDFYTWSIQPIEQHFFDTPRMYFSAIPQSEINSSNNTLVQNPGW